MKRASAYELPRDRLPALRWARRLGFITLIYMITAIVLMGLVMGNSQAMRTAWFEDMLVLIPTTAFLVASWIRTRAPNDRFPYGFHRVVGVAYLVSAATLFGFGLLLLYSATSTLIKQHHPTVGSVTVFGQVIWQGWLMLPVLVYATAGPLILGRLKMRPARELHDKVLYAEAGMLKADWLSSSAAAVGVIGIGLGWWWADAVAAAVISADILYDGWRNLRAVLGDLMDAHPDTADLKSEDPAPEQLADALKKLPWVRDVDLRMRESGHVFFTEVFIVPVDERDPLARTREAIEVGQGIDWRIGAAVVQLVDSLQRDVGPDGTPGHPAS